MQIPSSYCYYKLKDLRDICGITIRTAEENMIANFNDVMPSDLLKTNLNRNFKLPLKKQKSNVREQQICLNFWWQSKKFMIFINKPHFLKNL